MNIIMHYPNSSDGKKALEQEIADIHGMAVESYLKQSDYTGEDKKKIIEEIERKINGEGT